MRTLGLDMGYLCWEIRKKKWMPCALSDGNRFQPSKEFVLAITKPRRQLELGAEVAGLFVDGKADVCGRSLEHHAARHLEIHRAKVVAVDRFGGVDMAHRHQLLLDLHLL